ncbi:hypothetical protein MMC30_009247 [Trapelia coarctata]|nr:hypothetical protein [Trapelia coarctata]
MFVKKPGKEEEIFKVASEDDESFRLDADGVLWGERRKGHSRGRRRKGDEAGPSDPKERKKWEKQKKKEMKTGPHRLRVPDGPESRRRTFGDPPQSRWPPEKSRKQPRPVGDGKIFPGKAHRLIKAPDSEHSSDHQNGYARSTTSSSEDEFSPRRRRKRPIKGSRRKLPPGERVKKFPGKGYRLGDGTTEPAIVPSDTEPPAPRVTRAKWMPPDITPSLAPPKRRFPYVGLRKGIKNLFPGRRTSKAEDEKGGQGIAGPSSPPDPLDMISPEIEAKMAEESRRARARNKPLFPGNPHMAKEEEPPPSLRESGTPRASGSPRAPGSPAGSHHSAPIEIDGDKLREEHVAFQKDLARFPGVYRKTGLNEPEDLAAAERRTLAGDPTFSVGRSKSEGEGTIPSGPRSEGHSTSSEEYYQARVKERKKAERRKWPGKAYKLQPPPEPQASSSKEPGGKRFGLGNLGGLLRKKPQPSGSGLGLYSDSGESSDGSRESSKKFPGTARRLTDGAA